MGTHQTIRLLRGQHSSPEHGACVMEVASMLAGEPFTDEPRCVCPVIAEFLRTYNDEVDNARRQDLFAYAALVVGTRGDHRGERRRANLCLHWWRGVASPRRLFWKLTPSLAIRDTEIARHTARWAAASPARHSDALRMVEAMAGRAPMRSADAAADAPAAAAADAPAETPAPPVPA